MPTMQVLTTGFDRMKRKAISAIFIPARAAGFQSAAHIGPYLRMLIRSHHDTLGTAVR